MWLIIHHPCWHTQPSVGNGFPLTMAASINVFLTLVIPTNFLIYLSLSTAAGGWVEGGSVAGVCKQTGPAQRYGSERPHRQTGPAELAQQSCEHLSLSHYHLNSPSNELYSKMYFWPDKHVVHVVYTVALQSYSYVWHYWHLCTATHYVSPSSGMSRLPVLPRALGYTKDWTGYPTSCRNAKKWRNRRTEANEIWTREQE